jgi:hypothetical protein
MGDLVRTRELLGLLYNDASAFLARAFFLRIAVKQTKRTYVSTQFAVLRDLAVDAALAHTRLAHAVACFALTVTKAA